MAIESRCRRAETAIAKNKTYVLNLGPFDFKTSALNHSTLLPLWNNYCQVYCDNHSISVILQKRNDNSLDENFFEFLSRCQGNRMDEQRCELPKPIEKSKSTEDMLDMVERVQGDRMEEQRSDLPSDDESPQMPVLSTLNSHTPSGIEPISLNGQS